MSEHDCPEVRRLREENEKLRESLGQLGTWAARVRNGAGRLCAECQLLPAFCECEEKP